MDYVTCCVEAKGEDIEAMTEQARQITLATFKKHCTCDDFMATLGYSKEFPVTKDYAVSFWKSIYKGDKCYYIDHSRIEYIFI